MGYRSEVAYAIVFKSTEDRDAILNTLTTEERELIASSPSSITRSIGVELRSIGVGQSILFYDSDIKWYATDHLGQYGLTGYSEVDAHEKLLENAQNAENIYSMGVFIRLGEDLDDTDQRYWGTDNVPDGFPEWYDLVDIRRELSIGWDL